MPGSLGPGPLQHAQTNVRCNVTLAYPKAKDLSLGYDKNEDRLFLIFHLQDGGFRLTYLSRGMLGILLARLCEELAATHPMAGYTAQRDEVLQMEHVASVSNLVTDSCQSNPPALPEQPRQHSEKIPTEFPLSHYVSGVYLEMQQDALVTCFSGKLMYEVNAQPEPVAALGLSRTEAHRILRRLRAKAEFAEWNLKIPAEWMKPMESGDASNQH